MAGISKRISGSWVSGDYGIMKTATDTITTLPAVIYPNASTVTVGLKGNTIQNGTPTPQNPVDVNGTGERTGNLFDKNTAPSVGWYCGSDNIIRSSSAIKATYVSCSANTTYTISKIQSARFKVAWTANQPALGVTYHELTNSSGTTITLTTGDTANYLYIEYYTSASDTYTEAEIRDTIMLNVGSTALPYEPYGIKIPISCGDTTNNVYLGEVQTERKINKHIFTGSVDENWGYSTSGSNARVYLALDSMAESPSVCTHYQFGTIRTYPYVNEYCINNASAIVIGVDISSITSAADFKTYLQQQYANGTPVTVWYVLATPQTAIVNEPLMRIGDYADSLTTSVSCAAGENTLDVQTTVQPSEVTATFEGWHPVQSVHERSGGAWD